MRKKTKPALKSKISTKNKKVKSTLPKKESFPVIGIGGSAGGLAAFRTLLSSLSDKPRAALVFVMHLAPEHKSLLAELLAKSTKMPAMEVRQNMLLEANRVYVMPPKTYVSIKAGKLKLQKLKGTDLKMPIDSFFCSLAEERGNSAVGVILSGTATDGTLGFEAIKAAGGITLAQDKKSAQYDGMPQSAINAGCVDFVGSPKQIAKELEHIAKHPLIAPAKPIKDDELIVEGKGVDGVLDILFAAKGLDLTHYKINTINRRISRRIVLLKLKDIKAYTQFLRKNKDEVEKLYDDLLIGVTSFFRDPKVFQTLKKKVLPAILKNKTKKQGVRIWVPGCSTGEEAYSIAICLVEVFKNKINTVPVQIFATDISEKNIQKARKGLYGQSIKNDLTPEQLKRFFTKTGDSYQVSKRLREMCIFSKHNVFSDPPFSRVDLVSCRNLLIYLKPVLQKKIFHNFHYAISPGGFLVLGNSESAGGYSNLFKVVNNRQKIFAKKHLFVTPAVEARREHFLQDALVAKGKSVQTKIKSSVDMDPAVIAEKAILGEYASCGVLVDGNMDIVHFRGHTGRYLESASGRPSFNLFKLAREGLFMPLRTAIYEARETKHLVEREADSVKFNTRRIWVRITVIPVKTGVSREELFLILFEGKEKKKTPKSGQKPGKKSASKEKCLESKKHVRDLRRELMETKEYLQAVIEEKEGVNEELKTANEEILSTNEELQSANEELETSKEELQSSNEELTTANDELQSRNAEVSFLNDDLTNLLSSINMPIIMLGVDFVIRKITAQAEKVLNVIPSDVGQPINRIKLNVDIPDLEKILSDVMESLHPQTVEVQDKEGRWFSMYVRPYRTRENKIDGVVMIFIDNTEKKNAENALLKFTNAKARFAAMVSHELRSPLAIIKEALDIVLDGLVGQIHDEQKDVLDTARKSVDRLSRLIKNVLDFHKLEMGKMELRLVENDLNEVVTEVLESMRVFSRRKALDLRLEAGEGLSKVKFDRDKIVQVLMNFMGNSIRNTSSGSVIIETQREGDMAHVRVRDTGKGISTENLQKIFIPFERLNPMGEEEKGGTGLGLSIAKELISAHRGEIWVESELGSGTTFHFTVPL